MIPNIKLVEAYPSNHTMLISYIMLVIILLILITTIFVTYFITNKSKNNECEFLKRYDNKYKNQKF